MTWTPALPLKGNGRCSYDLHYSGYDKVDLGHELSAKHLCFPRNRRNRTGTVLGTLSIFLETLETVKVTLEFQYPIIWFVGFLGKCLGFLGPFLYGSYGS